MRSLHVAPFALLVLSSSCAVLGIDFDKNGLSSTSSSASTSSAAGGGMGGAPSTTSSTGGQGGEADTPGPDCGGFELLPSLSSAGKIYRLTALGDCTGAWDPASDSVSFNLPPKNNTNTCAVQSNWWFDGRGRRYSAHLTSDPSALGNGAAALIFNDQNGVNVTVGIRSNGSVFLNAFDPIGGVGHSVIDPIAIGTDRFIAARFSGDGNTIHIESKASANADWVERTSHSLVPIFTDNNVDLDVDAGFLRPGVSEGPVNSTVAGSASFDSVKGELAAPTTSKGACLAESLQATLKTAMPDEIYATTSCAQIVAGHLKLCPNTTTSCILRSRRLYKLNGSRLDLQVTSLGINNNAELQLGVAVPDGDFTGFPPFATYLSLMGNDNVKVLGQPTTTTNNYVAPIFLDLEEKTSGTVNFATHVPTMAEMPVGVATPLDGDLVELRFVYVDSLGCANVNSLNLPLAGP